MLIAAELYLLDVGLPADCTGATRRNQHVNKAEISLGWLAAAQGYAPCSPVLETGVFTNAPSRNIYEISMGNQPIPSTIA